MGKSEEKSIEISYDELVYELDVLHERVKELEKTINFNDNVIREQRISITELNNIIESHIKDKKFFKDIIMYLIERR